MQLDIPSTEYFEEIEWKAVWAYYNHKKPFPKEPPSLKTVTSWIGMLGGYAERKSDGPPGVIVIW